MPHQNKHIQNLENKQKQLQKACQKLSADLHTEHPNHQTLARDCEEICKIGHSCEKCCRQMNQ